MGADSVMREVEDFRANHFADTSDPRWPWGGACICGGSATLNIHHTPNHVGCDSKCRRRNDGRG